MSSSTTGNSTTNSSTANSSGGSASYSYSPSPPPYNEVLHVSKKKYNILKGYDYIFVIDKSTSMRKKMGKKRRIKVVEEVTLELISEAELLDPDGLTVYTFSSRFTYEDNVTADRAIEIFTNIRLSSGTTLGPVLEDIFKRYKKRKKKKKHKKGMIVVVVHDGEPDDRSAVIHALVRMANFVDHDKEIGVTFVQAGDDRRALDFLRLLDDDLYKKKKKGGFGAKRDIVDTKSIEWFVEHGSEEGFLQALID